MSGIDVDQLLIQLAMFRGTSLCISDHFDTGLCLTYQFTEKSRGQKFQQKFPETLLESHPNWQLGPLPPADVAPWRRVMCVMPLCC